MGGFLPSVSWFCRLHSVAEHQLDFQAVQVAADNGDAKAQFELARHFEKGNGVPKDYAKAVAIYAPVGGSRLCPGEGQLGYYYGKGLGVANNPQEALEWYRKSAEQGNAVSQYAMGYIYSTGRGTPKDMDQAVQWWRKAAEQNLVKAQYALGELYFFGQRGTGTNCINYAEAAKWFHKAAEQGYAPAMNNLGVIFDYGYGTPRNWPRGGQMVSQRRRNGRRVGPRQSGNAVSGWPWRHERSGSSLCLV